MNNNIEKLYGDNKEAYETLKEYETISDTSDEFYPYFDEFLKMLSNETSYIRVRGFRMICAQTKWDADNKINDNLDTILNILDDEKPAVVRQCLEVLYKIIRMKPNLYDTITIKLSSLDINKYSDSMRPLIQHDVEKMLMMFF